MDPPNAHQYMPTGIEHCTHIFFKKTKFSGPPDKYLLLGQTETLGYKVSEINVLSPYTQPDLLLPCLALHRTH